MAASIKTIVVCEAQVPFVEGGAEFHVRELVSQLRAHGFRTALVSVPFKWYPKTEILPHAAAWRMLDVSESNGLPIDLAIGTKFPSLLRSPPAQGGVADPPVPRRVRAVRHAVLDFDHVEQDVGLREQLMRLDRRDARRVPPRVQQREEHGRSAAQVQRADGGGAVSSSAAGVAPRGRRVPATTSCRSGRIESVKRVDAAVRAMALWTSGAAGRCRRRDPARQHRAPGGGVERRGPGHVPRCRGRRHGPRLYKDALGVVYAPFDEDFGYVTLEAFLAKRPVITATDSGGPLEFVQDGVNGAIVDSAVSRGMAARSTRTRPTAARARSHGEAGHAVARTITWGGVIERIIEAASAGPA